MVDFAVVGSDGDEDGAVGVGGAARIGVVGEAVLGANLAVGVRGSLVAFIHNRQIVFGARQSARVDLEWRLHWRKVNPA